MKNTKQILSAALVTALIVPMAVAAGNGNGNGNGQGQGGGEGKGRAEMQNTQVKTSDSEEKDCEMELPAMQDLSDYEVERLAYQYSEEMVARDAYAYFYALYGVDTFKNISESEQKHMDVVKKLLDRYGLETPSGYGVLQHEFDVLKAEGEASLKGALEAGVKIEILDIDDIAKTMRNVDNDDILTVYANIGGGSYNHMRGFVKALKNNGFTTDIDYSNYLTEEEADSKGGALKSKLSELLEAEGVDLPEMASAKAIAKKMKNHKHDKGEEGNEKGGKKNIERKEATEKMYDKIKKERREDEKGDKKGKGEGKGNGGGNGNGNGNNNGEKSEDRGFFASLFSSFVFWK